MLTLQEETEIVLFGENTSHRALIRWKVQWKKLHKPIQHSKIVNKTPLELHLIFIVNK